MFGLRKSDGLKNLLEKARSDENKRHGVYQSAIKSGLPEWLGVYITPDGPVDLWVFTKKPE